MKYLYTLFIILAGFVIDYCLYPKPSNDIETLEYVFKQDKINIDIFTCGCFGCGDDTIIITKTQNKIKLYNAFDKYQYITTTQLDTLKELLWKYIKEPPQDGYCTSSYYYKIGGHFNYLEINAKSNCTFHFKIRDQLKAFQRENSK